MLTKGFSKLLKRYREGTLPKGVKEAMDIWYHSIHKDPIEKNERSEIGERIWSGIREGKGNPENKGLPDSKPVWRHYGIWKAAVVVSILSAAAVYFSGAWSPSREQAEGARSEMLAGWVEVSNHDGPLKEVWLEEGSKVMLEPGAKLRYPAHFDADSRVVHLEGSAFFDVTKDSERPFLVHSGTVMTRVLGTSFRIKSIAETGATEVAVVTGKVMVEKSVKEAEPGGRISQGENRIVLTANKKVTFFKDSDHYVTGLVENPLIVSDQKDMVLPGTFNFDETPLSEVLYKLEKAYGVEITVSNDQMLECPVTADLSGDNLYAKIELIGAVLNAGYEITGSSILLSGGGCGPVKNNP